jgi:hypothetical protein
MSELEATKWADAFSGTLGKLAMKYLGIPISDVKLIN